MEFLIRFHQVEDVRAYVEGGCRIDSWPETPGCLCIMCQTSRAPRPRVKIEGTSDEFVAFFGKMRPTKRPFYAEVVVSAESG